MIISRTPLRISFVGGGTDIASFYRREPGMVISTAIDKYVYINVNKKFDRKIRVSYSQTEIVDHVDQLKHELVREALKMVGLQEGVEVTSISDVPAQGTGLGSSSSYTVGLLNALYAFTGQMVGADRLAREACEIEIERCRKPIGKQDQYIAAHGGTQRIQFHSDETVFATPLIFPPGIKERLEQHLVLLYTGITRSANEVLEEQNSNALSSAICFAKLQQMRNQVDALIEVISHGPLEGFGEILHQGWELKRSLASRISSSRIDEWYQCARRHGAIGGKLLGAGGGGFLLLFAPPEKREAVLRSLPELRMVPFRFEPQGSRIVFVE